MAGDVFERASDEEIGRRIRVIRESRGLTQSALADRMGLKRGQGEISKWETGRQRVSQDNLEELGAALEVPWEALVRAGPFNPTGDAAATSSSPAARFLQLLRTEQTVRTVVQELGLRGARRALLGVAGDEGWDNADITLLRDGIEAFFGSDGKLPGYGEIELGPTVRTSEVRGPAKEL